MLIEHVATLQTNLNLNKTNITNIIFITCMLVSKSMEGINFLFYSLLTHESHRPKKLIKISNIDEMKRDLLYRRMNLWRRSWFEIISLSRGTLTSVYHVIWQI